MSDTSCGLPAVLEAFLAEFFGFLGGLIVFILEKSNKYARSHACNAMIWGIIYFVLWICMAIFGALCSLSDVAAAICGIICALIGLFFFAVWVWNWVMALLKGKDEDFKAVPFVSKYAEKWADK